MKQPELGKRITELRKAKGLTQEELVEKCNISVRTIQRIETGDVTPRMYTIKTILAALDHDLDAIADGSDSTEPLSNRLKDLMMIDVDRNRPGLVNQLNIAWLAGIVYFVLGFLEAAAEYYRFTTDELIFGSAPYIVIKFLTLVSVVLFLRGLIAVGSIFGNYLLKVISMILIGAVSLSIAYDIVSIFYDSFERQAVLTGVSLTFGAMGIIFGIALRRLEGSLGRMAELAGLFEIVSACFFITVFFAFMGFIVQIPAILFEIILIYKTMETVKTKEPVNSLA
jgi:transcriptional regulator with XRE-family HTH domain